ncbi:hypothetical protein Q1695_013792 [Nippostrongylus brasiliensis]|nr:hypothetical protein Q1695_013792 [Nippostrongylus brasiliensis]
MLISHITAIFHDTLDAEPLFSHGGFGDFAMEDAEASAEFSKKYTSSIQHFDTISVFHMPDTTSLKRMIIPMPPFKIAHIKCPFTVIIYDNNKRMPFYFGRITRPRLVDMRATNAGENNEEKPGSAVHWCHFM